MECQPLLEWLANNYKSFGATLEIITDKSQEGSQFVRGFGGIGGEYKGVGLDCGLKLTLKCIPCGVGYACLADQLVCALNLWLRGCHCLFSPRHPTLQS